MRGRCARPRRPVDLANGPAKLAQAFGLDGCTTAPTWCEEIRSVDPRRRDTPPDPPSVGTRVGLSRGVDLPWRFAVPGVAEVSRPAPGR